MPKFVARYGSAAMAWIMLFSVTATFFALAAPGVIREFQSLGVILIISEAFLLTGVAVNLFMASAMDPGVLPRASASEEMQQNEYRIPWFKGLEVRRMRVRSKWCHTCHFYRPPRCSHCAICDHCIETFDHHCPWIKNCVGRRNYRSFYTLLVLTSLHIFVVFTLCLVYTLRTRNKLQTKENLVSITVLAISVGFSIPVLGLTSFHTFLVMTGRTTYEQLTGKYRRGYNPFNMGMSRNVAFICFGPQFPRYTGYVGKQDLAHLKKFLAQKSKSPVGKETGLRFLKTSDVPASNIRGP